MKHFILKAIFILTVSSVGFSQNGALICPPHYYDNVSNLLKDLPVPDEYYSGFGDYCDPGNFQVNDPDFLREAYDGMPAQGSSNMIVDEDGNIVFFIVDGVIFNKKGVGVAELPGYNYNAYMAVGENTVHGTNEITIVPDATNCERYYIFSIDMVDVGTEWSNNPDVVLYDSAEEEIVDVYPLNSVTPGQGLFTTNGSVLANMGYNRWANAAIAATKKQANENQYVIFSLNRYFEVAVLNDNGISPVGIFEKTTGNNSANRNRPILEVYDLANGNHILASQYNDGVTNKITLFTFDSNFANLLSEQVVPLPDNENGATAFVHGLEFSPNGEYLYFTHVTTSAVPGQLKYVALNNPTEINNVNVPSTYNFQFSEIEIRKREISEDVYVYSLLLAHNDGIAEMHNPDSPSSVTFSNLSSFSNTFNFASSLSFNQTNQTKYYQLPDQIDDFDYTSNDPVYYDFSTFSACENGIWQPNTIGNLSNNPFTTAITNHIYIKEELRIPAGKTITIKNMTLHFAPEAKVIVENGVAGGLNGGKLILDNSTLTVDDRCVNDMWLGVEVWGNSTLAQGGFTSSKQGGIRMINNSRIEHAYVGIMAGKRSQALSGNSPSSINTGGGIVFAVNSTFNQNRIGIRFAPYMQFTNTSYAINSSFKWEEALINEMQVYNSHIWIDNNKNIKIQGCDFENNNGISSPLTNKGYGLYVRNSHFILNAFCIGTGCVPDKNKFTNLNFGVYVTNFNSSPFIADQNEFVRNLKGMFVYGAKQEVVTRNKFEVLDMGTQTYGLYLSNSTGYTVQENDLKNYDNPFVPFADAKTFGIIANNSGVAKNLIYKNTFDRLLVGGQSQGVNAVLISDLIDNGGTAAEMTGLQWKCNKFFNTKVFDFEVANGRIDRNQGTINSTASDPVLLSARNQFSLSGEAPLLQHDFRLYNSQDINYVHLANINHTPNSRTVSVIQSNGGIVIPQQALNNSSQPIFMTTNGCPSNIISTGGGLTGIQQNINGINEQVALLREKLNLGNDPVLIENIKNTNNLGQYVQILVARSPYLSDDMLEAIINKNPNIGLLKQLLIENSSLTPRIKNRLETVSMPQGTRNQINAKQVGKNPRMMLESQILELEKQKNALENAIIGYDLSDEENLALNESEQILLGRNNIESEIELFDLYLTVNDEVKVNQQEQRLLTKDAQLAAYINLEREIKNNDGVKQLNTNNPDLSNQLILLKEGSIYAYVKRKVDLYLTELNDSIIDDTIYFYPPDKNMVLPVSPEQLELGKPSLVNIYPNPSTGTFFVDLEKMNEGKIDVQIFDVTGKLVYDKSFENSNGETITLDENLKGLFIVKVLLDKQFVESQKLEIK